MIYTDTIGTTTVYAIGKCPIKGCKRRARVVFPDMPILRDRFRTYSPMILPAPAPWESLGFPVAQRSYTVPSMATTSYDLARNDAKRAVGLICDEHNRFLNVTPVRGVVNESKACNGHCMNATGPDCECSCGGANHGAAWELA